MIFRAIVAMFLAATFAGCAVAGATPIAFIPTGELMPPPSGFTAGCRESPDARRTKAVCGRTDSAVARVAWDMRAPVSRSLPTPASPDIADAGSSRSTTRSVDPVQQTQIALLKHVNQFVNRHVVQRSDLETTGRPDVWRLPGVGPDAAGDCEDIALQKQYELVQRGFPSDRLSIAIGYSRAAGLHAVLIARTDGGDLVLDSRSTRLLPWYGTPYEWITVQSMDDPYRWHRVSRERSDTVFHL